MFFSRLFSADFLLLLEYLILDEQTLEVLGDDVKYVLQEVLRTHGENVSDTVKGPDADEEVLQVRIRLRTR